jgi:phosphoribosylamine--glycine ligase
MNTREGPKVIEYNARFGGPEAMNVLSILSSSFTDICVAIAGDGLASNKVAFLPQATVCKYVVPAGYGTEPVAGQEVRVDEGAITESGARAYYAMVSEEGGRVLTTSSRAVGVVGINDTIEGAERACEAALHHVTGGALFVRHDIGRPEVIRKRVEHMAQVRK